MLRPWEMPPCSLERCVLELRGMPTVKRGKWGLGRPAWWCGAWQRGRPGRGWLGMSWGSGLVEVVTAGHREKWCTGVLWQHYAVMGKEVILWV